MERAPAIPTQSPLRIASAFLAIGAVIYLLLLAGAEWLTYRNGHMNPLLKVERAAGDYDWVVLGASHAMPLDYDDFNAEMERASGRRIVNLAGPGAGPLYNRFVFEHFLRRHRTGKVLYVVDAFAFRAPRWNEERFADPKLLARTPMSLALAASLASYVWTDGVDPRAWLNYVSGFAKLNNRDRFARDAFEGEAQFDRVFKPSASADRKRIDYLYPTVDDEQARRDRYFAVLAGLIEAARETGAALVLAKFPVPRRFAELLPDEVAFDTELKAFAAAHRVELHDFSSAVEGKAFYADTDHLNRAGARTLLERHLRTLLTGGSPPPGGAAAAQLPG